jgi:hypothetical protein
MELAEALREALEAQVLEHEPTQAALLLRDAVSELGPAEVANGLLDTAAIALRLMVAETDEALPLDELIERLTIDGAVPKDSAELLSYMITHAAATAGGIRPTIEPTLEQIGPERVLMGAWLATLATIRVVAISLERTEADVVDNMVRALEHF